MGPKEGRRGGAAETVMALYEGAETAVRTADGITDWFKVLVGLHEDQCLAH